MSSLTQLANPTRFLAFSARVLPWLAAGAASLFALGLYLALIASGDMVNKTTATISLLKPLLRERGSGARPRRGSA